MVARRSLWYGRNRTVSGQLVLLAVGALALLSGVFYTDVNTLWPLPLAVSGPVILVAIAAAEAYYNEGMLVAWLVTFLVALPAFIFHPPRGPTFAVSPETAPVAVLRAAGVAVGFGTAGFVLGVWLRRRVDRERDGPVEPSPTAIPRRLLGRDRRERRRWSVLAVVEFAVLFTAIWAGILRVVMGFAGAMAVVILLGVMVGPAAVAAARNDGLLVSWLLAVAPLFGVFLAIQLHGGISPAPERPALYALGTALLFALPIGTIAYLAGRIARWVRESFGSASDDR